MNKKVTFVFLCILITLCSCMMGKSHNELYNEGKKLIKAGEGKKAFKYFKTAAKKSPDSVSYLFAAAQTAPDQNSAFMYTKLAWEKGLKNRIIFSLLLKYSFHTDKNKKLEYALSLFNELPDSMGNDVLKGELYFQFDKPDSAYALWNSEFIRTEKSFLCSKIAKALAKMGKTEQAIDFLYQCKKDKTIDADGIAFLVSLLAIQFNFKEVDRLFAEIQNSNFYNDKIRLEHATYLAFNNRMDEAHRLCRRPAGPGSEKTKVLIDIRFKTLMMYMALLERDTASFKRYLQINKKDSLEMKLSGNLFRAIKAFIVNDSTSYSSLKKAVTQLPPDPVTVLFLADAASKKKLYKEAAILYTKLPGIVLWAPRVVVNRAKTLSLGGQDDEALKVVSYMHKKRIFTRPSLELFRNITLKKDLLDKSSAAQKLLEKQYSNDIGLKWKGLLLAIKSEKYDSALTISQSLTGKYPQDNRFLLTQLYLLLMKKEYRKVLDIAAKSDLPDVKIKPIEAAAFKGLGDTAMAISAYESVVREKKDPLLVMQLAEMYYQKKMYDKAQKCYTSLIDQNEDLMGKDSIKLAILLNNNAWTIVTAGAKNLTGALSMAKRAHEIAPDNLNIIDTYVSILYEAGMYKESIQLLDGNVKALQQKRLLCHLARAYDALKNKNKAKRYYEDALVTKKENQKLSALMTDEQIKNEIKRLSE